MGTTQLESVPEPKYWHLKTVLSEALDSEFSVGEILPNERELAARFGVARATLRQALEQLELEGRLQRRRGVGTTVAPPRVGVAVGTEHARLARGPPVTPGSPSTVSRRRRPPPSPRPWRPARTTSSTPSDAPACPTASRSRPNCSTIPAASVPGLTAIDAPSGAARARAILRELQHLSLEGEDRAVELGSARAEDARELDRLPGSPVLVVTTRFFAQGRTAALSVATYRADTCRLTFGDSAGVEIHHDPERQAS
ncbi:GntR family transcriptional regulator [Streptomyces echinatus]